MLINTHFSDKKSENNRKRFFSELEKEPALREEFIETLNAEALSGWVGRKEDYMDAIPKWRLFKNALSSRHPANVWRRVAGYAASAIVAASLTLVVSRSISGHAGRVEECIETCFAPAGQRAQLSMSDGTKVWLNSNSRISYPSLFSGSDRRVSLEGEAYFEVAHDEKRPFYVSSKTACVKVIGTHFNVFDYPEDEDYSVSLTEGKVDVNFIGCDLPPVTLSPKQCVTKDGGSITVRNFADEGFLLWKKGIYAFDDCCLADMVKKLELYYDVRIIIKSTELDSFRFSGKFRQRDGIESLLRTLQKLHEFKYVKDDQKNVITIY